MHQEFHNKHLANVFERAVSAAGRLGGADCSSWQKNKKYRSICFCIMHLLETSVAAPDPEDPQVNCLPDPYPYL